MGGPRRVSRSLSNLSSVAKKNYQDNLLTQVVKTLNAVVTSFMSGVFPPHMCLHPILESASIVTKFRTVEEITFVSQSNWLLHICTIIKPSKFSHVLMYQRIPAHSIIDAPIDHTLDCRTASCEASMT